MFDLVLAIGWGIVFIIDIILCAKEQPAHWHQVFLPLIALIAILIGNCATT